MIIKDFNIKDSKEKWGLYAIYILGFALILPYTLYYCDNPDSWQYISLAEKISKGYFYLSINAFWSPLITWLIAIPIFLGCNAIISFKIIQLLIGFFAIDAWLKLSRKLVLDNWWRRIVCIAIIPYVLSFSILNLTPDLLFLTLTNYCLNLILKNHGRQELKSHVFLAFIGVLLYLTKAFGFPLFIALILLNMIFTYFKSKNLLTLKGPLISIVVFICLSSFWIIPLSIKNNHFTISEVAKFNMTREVAPLPGNIVRLPILNGPLLSPPDHFALSAWESPGNAIKLTPIQPFGSDADFSYYLQIVKRNLLSIWYYDFKNQSGVFFLISLLLYTFFKPKSSRIIDWKFIFLVSVILLFYIGYGLILVHTRYVWFCTWLMILLTVRLWEGILVNKLFQNRLWKVAVILLIVLAVKRPVKEILFSKDFDVPVLWIGKGITHPFETMRITYLHETHLIKTIKKLKLVPGVHGKLASLNSLKPSRDIYSSSCFITHELNSKYFGPLDQNLSVEEMKLQLMKYEIRYFIVWNHDNWRASNEEWVRPVYFNPDLGLTIYGLF
ncbi:MAG TPA: hypothetical protein PKM97_05610 [Bacteroidia bacterium]|nr:hypothetical protein [Bacteroidia bacterium]